MALDLSRAGMATHAIQQAGRWASPAMVVRYTRSESAGRGGGSADCSACRTVRRCTWWRRASSRMGSPSSRHARRISSNNSTLDTLLFFRSGRSQLPERSCWMGRGWGHFRGSKLSMVSDAVSS